MAANIRLPLELQSKKITDHELIHLLHKVHLDKSYLHHSIHELSGGMKMRTAMARSLVMSPACLFLDEPFSALDEHTRFGLQDLLVELLAKQNLSAVFVTHSIAEAVYLADRILILDRNGCLADEFIRPPEISRTKDLRNHVAFFETVQKVHRLYERAQGRGET